MALLVAAIIGREITMSALREWAASCSQEAHQAVAVSSWGKWKTATQVRPHAFCTICLLGHNAALPSYSWYASLHAKQLSDMQHSQRTLQLLLVPAVLTAL